MSPFGNLWKKGTGYPNTKSLNNPHNPNLAQEINSLSALSKRIVPPYNLSIVCIYGVGLQLSVYAVWVWVTGIALHTFLNSTFS